MAAAGSVPGAPAVPAFFPLEAPDDWRAIDFISDLHLSEAMPRTFDAFARHLQRTPADAVFILGDLFEVWVGDDVRGRAFERQCVRVLADAASHRQLGFMVGNRDFLVGAAMLRDSGLLALADPTLLLAWQRPVLLSHGDALCLDDTPYQAFRRQVRSPAWQASFLAKPLAERLAMAAEMRRASEERRRFDGNADSDVDTAEAVRWLHAIGANDLVHGHTHRPATHVLAPGYTRYVLTDWDLDHGQRAEVLRLTRQGFARVPPAAG